MGWHLVALLVVALLVAAIAWLLLVAEPDGQDVDEHQPTLDTRNHLDDPDG